MPCVEALFCARRMLVGAVHGAVDAVPLVIPINGKSQEDSISLSDRRPTIEAIKYRIPRPKLRRKVPPWSPRTHCPKNGFYEVSIVGRRAPRAALFEQDLFQASPHSVVQTQSQHGKPWSTRAGPWTDNDCLSVGTRPKM